jgi:Tfp pilus assembly protein PilX
MRRLISFKNNQESGFILAIFLITTILIAGIIVAVSSTATLDYSVASRESYKVNAQFAADAGLDYAIESLTANGNWTGNPSEVTLLNTSGIKTTYRAIVVAGADATQKTIRITSKAYVPSTATTPKITRIYDMDVRSVTSGTSGGSVVTGVGGLILKANSKISGGDVLVNGKISIANNSQIGLSTNPVNVRVAHQSCPSPADATFPQVCGSGQGQPISISASGHIYGNVQATNQTTGTNMTNPGLIANSTFAPVALPAFDRTSFKATINASGQTMTAAQATNCTGSPKTVNWPANVKITGNISMSNGCTVKINGNVWITGGVDLSNLSTLAVQNSVGTTMPVIVTDGIITGGVNGGNPSFALSNNGKIQPNSSNTGVQVISFYSNAACSPDCATLTGTALATSQPLLTIDLGNNGTAQYSNFYAYWTMVRVSNNGTLGSIAGQTVDLEDNAVISFTSSVPGSNNQITTWVKRGYMRVYQ